MSRPDRREFLARLDRTVESLRASGLSEPHLRWGALVAMHEGLPLRDTVVIRFARQRAEMETDRAREAWASALDRCGSVLSPSEIEQWVQPIELVGEDAGLLVLAAPTRIRTWLERHYLALLSEAVRRTEQFAGVRIAAVTLPVPLREVYAQ